MFVQSKMDLYRQIAQLPNACLISLKIPGKVIQLVDQYKMEKHLSRCILINSLTTRNSRIKEANMLVTTIKVPDSFSREVDRVNCATRGNNADNYIGNEKIKIHSMTTSSCLITAHLPQEVPLICGYKYEMEHSKRL